MAYTKKECRLNMQIEIQADKIYFDIKKDYKKDVASTQL